MANILFFVLTICLLFQPGTCFGTFLTIHEGKMSLKADQVPLMDLLRQVSAAGIRVKIDPKINPRISADFRDREIQSAFEEILKGYSQALIWTKDPDQGSRVLEVIIFRPGQMDRAQHFTAAGSLAVEKDPATGAFYIKNRVLVFFPEPISRMAGILKRFHARLETVHPKMGIHALILEDTQDIQRLIQALEHEGLTAEPDFAYPAPVLPRISKEPENKTDAGTWNPESSFAVAVLDTGIMEEYAKDSFVKGAFNALAPESPASDTAGHGTQMALIASGRIQPIGADPGDFSNPVLSIRAFDDSGFTSNSTLMKSIDYALENGARVLSLSWGSETRSTFLEAAVNYAAARGLFVVAAAGNHPTGSPVYPAAYDSVIAVSALGPDGNPWDQSNYGEFVDLAAPGFAHLPVGYEGDPGTYAGTSIATAYLAGKLAAWLRDHPDAKAIDPGALGESK